MHGPACLDGADIISGLDDGETMLLNAYSMYEYVEILLIFFGFCARIFAKLDKQTNKQTIKQQPQHK